MKVLVTGAAGFIGAALTQRLLAQGHEVFGLDNLNDYYEVSLKQARLKRCQAITTGRFVFEQLDLADRAGMEKLFRDNQFDAVVNLAAQAGVRYSLDNPQAYIDSNLVGFANILEGCRHAKIKNLIFASSSSVYGANSQQPFAEHHHADHPVSLYGATKRANELLAHSYASLYQLPCTGLRFFTVYGPWGRPDMAIFKFTRAIAAGEQIDVYNQGEMWRDFTYIDDIIDSMMPLLEQPASPSAAWSSDAPNPASSYAPYRVYNIGNENPVNLLEFIKILEKNIGKTAQKNFLPMQPGDVLSTHADVSNLMDATGVKPHVSIEQGVQAFVAWYQQYYAKTPCLVS